MTTKSNTTHITTDLNADIDAQVEHEAFERLEFLKKETAALEARLAKGTRDLTIESKKVTATFETRIEAALRGRPMSIEELARELKETTGRVVAAIKPLRKKLCNVGTENLPAWFWVVGDESPTHDINAAVLALIRYKPMRFPELLAATGARAGRVSGAIVALQRNPKSNLVNLDTTSAVRARWFILPSDITPSRLKRR